MQAFLARPLESSGYADADADVDVYLDATYLKGRLGKAQQVCSRAVVVAMGVNDDGRRELLGLKVGDSETESFLAEFNRCAEGKAYAQLKERGLSVVRLVIYDAHAGLTKAIRPSWRKACGSAAESTSPATCCSASPRLTGHGHRCHAQRVRPGNCGRDRVPLG